MTTGAVSALSPEGKGNQAGAHHYAHATSTVEAAAGGVAGSGEELAVTLEKIVSQLSIISGTLQVLDQRVAQNEGAVNTVMKCFEDAKIQKEKDAMAILQYAPNNLAADTMQHKNTLDDMRTLVDNMGGATRQF